jgi:fructose PTS system EIIBC or EIIC component
MKISEYLKKEYCVMELNAVDKEGVIREIAGLIGTCGMVNDGEGFIQSILERESLGSTGIGHKVSIPHSRTDTVKSFVIGFGRSNAGIDFKAIDGDKVNLVFLMGANPGELNLYLRLLAELSKLLMEDSFRRELMVAATPEEVIKAIKKFEQ